MLTISKLKKHYVYIFFVVFIIFSVFKKFPVRYEFVKQEDVWKNLAKVTAKNLTYRTSKTCDYIPVFNDDSKINLGTLSEVSVVTNNLKIGGEHFPHDCKPSFSVAIIVPYRDRDKQLKDFLTYMHLFLQKQNLHYRIYVVEQDDVKPFNRAKLLNIGSAIAIQHGFPCLILHDVDLLPLVVKNIYVCTKLPRHMSTSIDKFRFTLPYNELFGGVVSLLSEQFIAANGMSNSYYGWGGEDDDFYERLQEINLKPIRFDPDITTYTMMKHKSQIPSTDRTHLLSQASQRFATDGLNSLSYTEKATKLHPLFTHIIVQL